MMACEKVIDVDLNEADPTMVIESAITTENVPFTALLTKSSSYFDSSEETAVNNATVVLSDDSGNSEILSYINNGVYQSNNVTGVSGRRYTLTVESDEKTYTGSVNLPKKVEIDSAWVEKDEIAGGGFGSPNDFETYSVFCSFKDPANVENYYQFIIFINGEEISGFRGKYSLSDDENFDGRDFTYAEVGLPILPGDQITFQLNTLDFSTYDYYSTLNDIIGGGGGGQGSPTPANPNTNLSNGAAGYFGAYTISEKSVIAL